MSGVVVTGATGGCGTTTLACAIALRHAQAGGSPVLIGAGADYGGPSDLWGVPAARTLDDLLPLGSDLTPVHISHIIHSHASGVGVIVGPRSPGAAAAWEGDMLDALVEGATGGHEWIADLGRAGTPLAHALAARADHVVVVVPARVECMAQASHLIGRMGNARTSAMWSPLPAAGDLPVRAMRRALGDIPVIVMPSDRRGAADVMAGRLPSRRGLGRAIAELDDLP